MFTTIQRIGRWLIFLSSFCAILACSTIPDRFRGAESPLLFDPDRLARADTVVVMVGGALSDRNIFTNAEAWQEDHRVALVYFRLPGMDGLPLDHRLGIEDAARQIQHFASMHETKRIRLLGYSTGGPIVLTATAGINGDVRTAVLSPAVERAGGVATALRASFDILQSSLSVGTLQKEKLWRDYYKTLLYGRKGRADPTNQENIRRISRAQEDNIILPDADLQSAHTKDLRHWRIPPQLNLRNKAVRIYIGREDPVFSRRQTQIFANRLGGVEIVEYAGQGHLLFFTRPIVFDEIANFFEL